jgi:AcrR family transcriptional regulator
MPTKRFERLDPELKATLMEAATEEFAQNGYEDASLNRIIEAASISKGSLYYYFEDKQDVYVSTLLYTIGGLEEELRALRELEPTDDFWHSVHQMMARMFEITLEHPRLLALFKAGIPLMTPAAVRAQTPLAKVFGHVKAFTQKWLTYGIQHGAVREDVAAELLVELVFTLGETLDRWLLGKQQAARIIAQQKGALEHFYTDCFRRIAAPAALLAQKPSPAG